MRNYSETKKITVKLFKLPIIDVLIYKRTYFMYQEKNATRIELKLWLVIALKDLQLDWSS